MAALMVHRDVLRGFGKLPLNVQRKMTDFIDRFQADPNDPGIRLHPLKATMADKKVRGAELPGGYRAIIVAPEQGDTYLLVHIDSHDEAYAWAANKCFEVHPSTGMFQMIDLQVITSAAMELPSTTSNYILNRFTDDELFSGGVPRPLLAAVRAINSDDDLLSLSEYLPADCRDVLVGLASGMTIDEALSEMLGLSERPTDEPQPSGSGDFRHLTVTPTTDFVLIGAELSFQEALRLKIEEWRVFLHPYQRKLVQWDVNGPMSITGSAGTGKTVVLMHRAVRLARSVMEPGRQVLVTTFTTNLSTTLKHHITKALAPDVASAIEVTNLHALARTICSRSGWNGRIATDEDIQEAWRRVWLTTMSSPPLSNEEMANEFTQVVDSGGIVDEDQYLTAIRGASRPRMSRVQRRDAWLFFVQLRQELKKANLLTFDGSIREARLAVERGNASQYQHVLVDEAQDFNLEALRLVRALARDVTDSKNCLCLFGDPQQRIYRSRVSFARAGIEVRGRSRRLKVNYRTSEEIRRFAQRILLGVRIDDFEDGLVSTLADHSLFRGPTPKVFVCTSGLEEAEIISHWVKKLLDEEGLASHEICIAYERTPKTDVGAVLNNLAIQTYQLRAREEDPGSSVSGVRMGTIKRIKGLEFRAVALACADFLLPSTVKAEFDLRALASLYVAATRAREYLIVTTANTSSVLSQSSTPEP